MNISNSQPFKSRSHSQPDSTIGAGNHRASSAPSPSFNRTRAQSSSGRVSEFEVVDRIRADRITLHNSNILTAVNLLRKDPRFKGRDLPVVSFAVNRILKENGIQHRFGGSMAGALHGGHKTPSDVDVEVSDKHDLHDAINLLSKFDDQVKMPNGTFVHMRGERVGFRLLQGNAGGMVKMYTTHQDGRATVTYVDITNENHHRMVGGLIPPNYRSPPVNPRRPNYLGPHDLIANYLDRMIKKPSQSVFKEDSQQIANILRKMKIDPSKPSHVKSIVREISALAKPGNEHEYANLLREVLAQMAAGHI